METLISCIIAVYNGERFIKEALDSILEQSYPSLEVIVVDDGSTDKTRDLVTGYGARVVYVWQENSGPGAARNRGLDSATGEFVAFLDADDLWHPEKLMIQMSRFEERPELELCVAHAQNFWAQELEEEQEQFEGHRLSKPTPCYLTQAILARKNLFDKLGYFNTRFRHVHDSEWFVRASDQGIVTELLPDVLVYRRLHKDNRSRNMADASRDEYLELMKASIDRKRGRLKPSSG
jgi:glycosyltransferase involved in cell wall biosynthesis